MSVCVGVQSKGPILSVVLRLLLLLLLSLYLLFLLLLSLFLFFLFFLLVVILLPLLCLVDFTRRLAIQLLVSSDRMSLDLLLPDFPLGKKARMTANALSVVYKTSSLSMEITSTFLFKVKDTELGFTATLGLKVLPKPGLSLSVLMVGTWREAFGIKPLTVTALSGSITVVPVKPFIKAFEFNAAIELGVVKFAAGIGTCVVVVCID
jgi:hypothetical protein